MSMEAARAWEASRPSAPSSQASGVLSIFFALCLIDTDLVVVGVIGGKNVTLSISILENHLEQTSFPRLGQKPQRWRISSVRFPIIDQKCAISILKAFRY